MAIINDRVYRLDEIGQNELIQNEFGRSEIDNLPFGGGGGSTGGGGGNILAFNPYTSPYITPRRVFFTINTYTNLSKKGVLAKAYLNGVEVEDQSISNGRITFSLEEQRLLNPSTLTLVSGDLKPQKYFIIQSRKDVENEVSIIEYDTTTDIPTVENAPVPTGIGFVGGDFNILDVGVAGGFGGGSSGGGGGGFVERDFGTGFGRERVVQGDLADRQNLQ